MGGALWASTGAELHVAALIVLAAATQLGIEQALERWQRRAQLARMRQWCSSNSPQRPAGG